VEGFGRLIAGLIAVFAILFMTFAFGVYGLFFTLGLFGVMAWARSAKRGY